MPPEKDYMDILRERSKKSHIYQKHQMVGLMLSEMLKDEGHKALYIKLAKEHDQEKLLGVARRVADKINVKNKGAYFMRVFFGKKARRTKGKKNNNG
ncbi:MAG: hypothetical protein ABSF47_03555 [Minisyncoccia bacterium]|jgi:hypothetical protein